MISVILFLLLLVGFSWVQMHYLAPVKTKKEWAVFLSVMVVVAGAGINLILDIDLSSPMDALRGFVEPLGKSILH